MLIKLRCRSCFAKVSADDDLIGKKVNCPNCSHLFELPKPQFGFGKVLGGYEIEQWLGAGAMGEVYLARQISMNRLVALKIIKHDAAANKEVVDRFLKEAQILASLNHPNIVPAFDAGSTDECYYMAMGYIDGETLEDKLKRKGVMKESEALKISLKVVGALEYAWTEYKLLHRDIKPANIMIDSMDEVKIMDMGIAKNTNDNAGLTQVGLVVGTPFYMSPEQAQASSGIDFRSDVYALAASLYHLVTGKLPFGGPNVMAILAKKVNYPLVPPNQINFDLSDETSDLIVNLLNYNPDQRISSFEEIKSAFINCLKAAKKNKKGSSSNTTKTRHMAVPDKLLEHGLKSRKSTRIKRGGSSKASASGGHQTRKSKSGAVKVIAALITVCLLLGGFLIFSGNGNAGETSEDEGDALAGNTVGEALLAGKLSINDFVKKYALYTWSSKNIHDRSKISYKGMANYGKFGELVMREGCFYPVEQHQKKIDSLKKAQSFTFYIHADKKKDRRKGLTVMTLGEGSGQAFSLKFTRDSLLVSWINKAGKKIVKNIGDVPRDLRLAIVYANKKLTVYIDGKVKANFEDVLLQPSSWKNTTLVLGAESKELRNKESCWTGRIFNFAVFDQAMSSEQVERLVIKSSQKR